MWFDTFSPAAAALVAQIIPIFFIAVVVEFRPRRRPKEDLARSRWKEWTIFAEFALMLLLLFVEFQLIQIVNENVVVNDAARLWVEVYSVFFLLLAVLARSRFRRRYEY